MTTQLPQVVVIAGGQGTRLGRITERTPKIVLPVEGRVFLDYVLDLLGEQGVRRVHFCLGHLAKQVIDHLTSRCHDTAEYTWSVESQPLGTAGALRLALPMLEDEFVVLLGDTYTPISIRNFLDSAHYNGLKTAMAVFKNKDWLVQSNVTINDQMVERYFKGGRSNAADYVDYGILLIQKQMLRNVRAEVFVDLGEVYDDLTKARQLGAVEVFQRFYEIGSPHGYAEFSQLVRDGAIIVPKLEKR